MRRPRLADAADRDADRLGAGAWLIPSPAGRSSSTAPAPVMVATDAMFVYLDALDRIADRMRGCGSARSTACRCRRLSPERRPTPAIWTSMVEVDRAAGVIDRAGARCGAAPRRGAHRHRTVFAGRAGCRAASAGARGAGRPQPARPLLRVAILLSLARRGVRPPGSSARPALFGSRRRHARARCLDGRAPRADHEPGIRRLVRGFSTSLDDAIGGLAGVPPGDHDAAGRRGARGVRGATPMRDW